MDELVGKRFGHWTVLSECNYRTKGGNKIKAYNCVCDCGTKRVVLKQSLLRGVSQSCGCSINHIRDEEKHSFWDSEEEIPSVIAMWFSTIALIVNIIKLF